MKIRKNDYFKICLVILFCFVQVNSSSAASKKELALDEAAESIGFISQQITKAYFYRSLGIGLSHARKDIENGKRSLNISIKKLEENIIDNEEKNVLLFISFTRTELNATLAEPFSLDNASLMMDYSETLLEGAEVISGKLSQKGKLKTTTLQAIESMVFLLERINKYYIAEKAGLKDYNNEVQLKAAVVEFEKQMAIIMVYKYPVYLQSNLKKINRFWPIAKEFYLGIKKGSLPVIVRASTDTLRRELETLEDYHDDLEEGDDDD